MAQYSLKRNLSGALEASVKAIKQRVSAWFERNFTWRGAAALLLLVVKEIPSWFSREAFWSKNLPLIGKFIYDHSTIFFIALVGVLIWLDHRIVLKRQGQKYDLKSLKGRTLSFCDKLRNFKNELGPEPEIVWADGGMNKEEFNKANESLARREQKMHHGFKLRFYGDAAQLFHEHGEEMRENPDLGNELAGRIETNKQLDRIIQQFSDLAEMSD